MGDTGIIVLQDLEKTFYLGENPVPAVRDFNLTVGEGELLCLVGPSGCGKSTLLNLIGGLDRPTGGKILVKGTDITRLSENDLCLYRRRQLGFVFQSFNLLPQFTALENVELPLIFAGVERRERLRLSTELLDQVGLGDRLSHRPTELSGGQQQRVAIARALINHPGILLADEPTGNLDTASGSEIMSLIKNLNKQGITGIIATHDREVAAYAHRVIVLRDGAVIRIEVPDGGITA